jgi:hypothetical protein
MRSVMRDAVVSGVILGIACMVFGCAPMPQKKSVTAEGL